MSTIPITKRGAEKLKSELHRLKTVDRPGVIQAIAEARAQGDLSENRLQLRHELLCPICSAHDLLRFFSQFVQRHDFSPGREQESVDKEKCNDEILCTWT